MITKYSAQVVNHGYSKNNCEFFTLSLSEIPKITISKRTKRFTQELVNLGNPMKHVVFKGHKDFDMIKHKHQHNLPIFIKGEVNIVQTPFIFTPQTNGKPLMVNTFNPETGKYEQKPVAISTIKIFIDERPLQPNNEFFNYKTEIIKKEINKRLKYRI